MSIVSYIIMHVNRVSPVGHWKCRRMVRPPIVALVKTS